MCPHTLPVSKHPCISAGNFSCISPGLGGGGLVARSALRRRSYAPYLSLPGDVVVQMTHDKYKITVDQQLQLDTKSRLRWCLQFLTDPVIFPNMCPNPPGLPHLPPSHSSTSQQRATPLPHFSLLHSSHKGDPVYRITGERVGKDLTSSAHPFSCLKAT